MSAGQKNGTPSLQFVFELAALYFLYYPEIACMNILKMLRSKRTSGEQNTPERSLCLQ